MNLINELKRRKVFRVAAVYAVVAWLLIQVADTVAPMLTLPDYVPRLVLFLLVILFPVAIFLAWAYELSPEGVKADSGEEPAPTPGRNLFTAVFVAVAVLGGLGLYLWSQPEQAGGDPQVAQAPEQSDTSAPAGLEKSIAVLPFNAFSANPDEQYFADGLADTLLHKLAQLRDIRVISRSSSFQYRGEAVDVRQVGEELNVATVLEGSVQRSGDQLRIIAQLVNTEDGGHIWSQTFDRSSDDIFAIHDEISEAVVSSLQLNLSPEEQQRLEARGTTSIQAYNRLTQIMEDWRSIELFEINDEEYKQRSYASITELERVLDIDPEYAAVYRAMATIYQALVFQANSATDDIYHLTKGFDAIQQAMLLEPDNPENYVWLASLTRRSGDSAMAEVFARMAVRELPNSAAAVAELRLALGAQEKNPHEQLELVARERTLGAGPFVWRREARALRLLNRFDEAENLLRNELDTTDEPQLVAFDLSQLLVLQGRNVEAMEALIAVRNQLEDEVNDIFLRAWTSTAHVSGRIEEAELQRDRIQGDTRRAVSHSISLFYRGEYQEGRAFIENVMSQLPDSVLRYSLARHCLMLEDYDCVVTNALIRAPSLDSREGKAPSLNGRRDLEAAFPLVVAYRKLGDESAATRLLEAVSEYFESRTVEGFTYSEFYQLPMLYFLLGDKEPGLRLMRERIELEGNDFVPLCQLCSFASPIYESVQDDPEFQRLVAEYDRRRAASGETVRDMIAEAGY